MKPASWQTRKLHTCTRAKYGSRMRWKWSTILNLWGIVGKSKITTLTRLQSTISKIRQAIFYFTLTISSSFIPWTPRPLGFQYGVRKTRRWHSRSHMIVTYICLVPAIAAQSFPAFAAQRMNKQTDAGKITFVSPPNLRNLRGKPLKNLFDNDSLWMRGLWIWQRL